VYWQSYALHASRATARRHRYPALSYDCLQPANSSVILARRADASGERRVERPATFAHGVRHSHPHIQVDRPFGI
jgi:hypothetical protein